MSAEQLLAEVTWLKGAIHEIIYLLGIVNVHCIM